MRLGDYRKSRGWTQSGLATRLGVAANTVARYERGRLPDREVLERIIALTAGRVTPNDWFSLPEVPEARRRRRAPGAPPSPIVLFTDFGFEGPYTGQMKAALARDAPGVPVIDLFADAPAFDSQASAYLLAAYAQEFPLESVFLAVVDPGVGGQRAALAVAAGGRWFVGPDNGLAAIAARRGADAEVWQIVWRPERLSTSFHGRDLFAPVAAALGLGECPGVDSPAPLTARRRDGAAMVGKAWPDDLARIVYIDVFGNAMTGLRAATLPANARLGVGGWKLAGAQTFSDVAAGAAFWYENANGLAEIAVNGDCAERRLGLAVGAPVTVLGGV